jgi:hypothetical protein
VVSAAAKLGHRWGYRGPLPLQKLALPSEIPAIRRDERHEFANGQHGNSGHINSMVSGHGFYIRRIYARALASGRLYFSGRQTPSNLNASARNYVLKPLRC